MDCDICVIGGGASGMAAAIAAARGGAKTVIAERNPRVGKKLLATGNGRCNLSHTAVDKDCYYGDTELAENVLRELGTTGAFVFFRELGVLLHSDAEGRVYPYSNSANTVLDALRGELERLGVVLLCGCRVERIVPQGEGFRLEGSENIRAKRVIVAAGGKAAPGFGSDGSGFELLSRLGINITPVSPALAGIRCGGTGSLKGVRARAAVSLVKNGVTLAAEQGEVQFAEQWLSGICVFDLARFAEKGCELRVDLLPDFSESAAAELLAGLDPDGKKEGETLLCGLMNRRLARAVCAAAASGERSALASSAKGLSFEVGGVMPFENAQVTAGGVTAGEVGTDLQFRRIKGLYAAGEVLDVDGRCGGYNLHWAWASGIRAGREAAASLACLE